MPKVLDSFSPGVMESWSVANRDINPLVITPKLITIES
jgi:hypothetical protein